MTKGPRSCLGPQDFNRFEPPQLPPSCFLGIHSGADRDRTGDPLVANQVLSQLSYRPE